MKRPVGRPTKMTPENIAKLEIAFSNGASDVEACFVAGITKTTLYEYCIVHPEFTDRKEALKDMVKYQARTNVADAVRDGDKSLSQWYLERKVKEEFAQRSELTGQNGGAIEVKQITGMKITPDNGDTVQNIE